MPELPEVETTVRGLRSIIGNKVNYIKVHTKKLRYPIPQTIYKIKKDLKINNIDRIGKYIIINFDNNTSLIIHLGMSGRLKIISFDNFTKIKHDHFILRTNRDHCIVFNDPRKFGFIDYCKTSLLYNKNYILRLGIDGLSSSLNPGYLHSKFSKSTVPVKQLLLDQGIIAGIGNIYASEILFDAKISPLSKGNTLDIVDIKLIIKSTRKILKKAINAGGSSLKDYVDTDGIMGNFQNKFRVYGKQDQKVEGYYIKK